MLALPIPRPKAIQKSLMAADHSLPSSPSLCLKAEASDRNTQSFYQARQLPVNTHTGTILVVCHEIGEFSPIAGRVLS